MPSPSPPPPRPVPERVSRRPPPPWPELSSPWPSSPLVAVSPGVVVDRCPWPRSRGSSPSSVVAAETSSPGWPCRRRPRRAARCAGAARVVGVLGLVAGAGHVDTRRCVVVVAVVAGAVAVAAALVGLAVVVARGRAGRGLGRRGGLVVSVVATGGLVVARLTAAYTTAANRPTRRTASESVISLRMSTRIGGAHPGAAQARVRSW